MRVQKRGPWPKSLGVVLVAMALWGAQAQAQPAAYVSSDKPGSVAIWPKVIADGTRDTLITLTNVRNEMAHAHCEYVQALAFCATTGEFCTPGAQPFTPGACDEVPGNVCVPQWQSADFDITLTRQQPTMWRVSTGRRFDPTLFGNACVGIIGTPPSQACPGLFPISVPPAPDQPFRGELKCIQVGEDGSPVAANALKGEAMIEYVDPSTNQISKYNSINVEGISPSPIDGLIRLNGIEYAACPEAIDLSHYATGREDLVAADLGAACAGSNCAVHTEITLVPCRQDFFIFDNPDPGANSGTRVSTTIVYHDEFESPTSASAPFQCWANFDLRDLNINPNSGTTFQRTRVIPPGGAGNARCILGNNYNGLCADDDDCGPGGVCAPASGVLAIVEEFHTADDPGSELAPVVVGTAASNGYSVDLNNDGILGRAGRCRNNLGLVCTSDEDCLAAPGSTGRCRYSSADCTSDAACPGTDPDDFCDLCMNDEINIGLIDQVGSNPP
ncbi:MAG: hypothetical protein AB7V27_04565 [Candidatus Binatia bacterium]